MCTVCVEFTKGKLTFDEAFNAFDELIYTASSEESSEEIAQHAVEFAKANWPQESLKEDDSE